MPRVLGDAPRIHDPNRVEHGNYRPYQEPIFATLLRMICQANPFVPSRLSCGAIVRTFDGRVVHEGPFDKRTPPVVKRAVRLPQVVLSARVVVPAHTGIVLLSDVANVNKLPSGVMSSHSL